MIKKQVKSKQIIVFVATIFAMQVTQFAHAQTTPSPCRTMYFGNARLACLQSGSGGVVPSLQGSDSSSIPPATQWCQSVTPGTVISSIVPAPGSMACYQFTVQNMGSVNVQASLPTGIVGSAELYNINPNTSGFKLAESFYPNKPLSTSYSTQFMRIVLVVKASNGVGDAPMNIGVNNGGVTPSPSNGAMGTATTMAINDTAFGGMATPLGVAYYFYPLKAGQTKASIRATFTANQQAGYRFAQKTGPGAFNVQPEIVLTPAQNNQNIVATSPYPANTAATTAPSGVLVRIAGINGLAPANESFTARVGVADVIISSYDLVNTETITRWYPDTPGLLDAATYITANALVTDIAGASVKGQDVLLNVKRNTQDPNAAQTALYRTDDSGRISITTLMPACTGTVSNASNYGPPGTPTDHWNGTAQTGSVIFDVMSNISGSVRTQSFTRICSETYLGRY
jgi:hypothetical protein